MDFVPFQDNSTIDYCVEGFTNDAALASSFTLATLASVI